MVFTFNSDGGGSEEPAVSGLTFAMDADFCRRFSRNSDNMFAFGASGFIPVKISFESVESVPIMDPLPGIGGLFGAAAVASIISLSLNSTVV